MCVSGGEDEVLRESVCSEGAQQVGDAQETPGEGAIASH